MKKLPLRSLQFVPAVLGLGLCLGSNNALAGNVYFDVNGTSSGYGVVNGGSYSWDDPNWATASGGTAATGNYIAGSFARFSGGVSGNAYTVTVNNDESMAGMYQTVSGVSLTINGAGAGTLDVATGDQGFLVSGAASKVIINAPISGVGGVAPELSGSLYLYGNNTYSGGTAFGYSGSPLVYYNNNNSFGTGPINIVSGVGANSYWGLLGTGGATITLPNTFSFASTTAGFNFAGNPNTPVVSTGPWNLGANTVLIRSSAGSSSPVTLSGAINGTGGLILSANNAGNVITLSGANTYSGTTTVTGIGGANGGSGALTLKLGVANAIASSSKLIMSGGTVNPSGNNQIMSSTTLLLTDNSTFDFGAGASEMDFANSASELWTSGKVLNLANWTFGEDALRFGTDLTGLTSTQLAEIEFNGDASTLGSAMLDANGYLVVPEPSTVALGLLGALGAWMARRRKA